MMEVQTKPLTIEEFWGILSLPENEGRQFELITGAIEEMPPSSYLNSMVAAAFVSYLAAYARENNRGFVSGADGGYALAPDTVFVPDAGFVSRERLVDFSSKIFPGAPDLAVEVISPSETHPMVLNKVRRYLQAGTQIVWAAYAEEQIVNVYRLLSDGELAVQTLGIDDHLEGGAALPGFSVALLNIFPQIESNQA
jgi:Uma2 family endonuclease